MVQIVSTENIEHVPVNKFATKREFKVTKEALKKEVEIGPDQKISDLSVKDIGYTILVVPFTHPIPTTIVGLAAIFSLYKLFSPTKDPVIIEN